jgi:phenylacetate-CoA ligase
MLLPTGNTVMFDIRHTVGEQLQWLERQQPDYLLSYPSNLASLAEACITNPIQLKNLRSISTLGEILTPKHRQLFRQVWGVETHDVYSAEEVGFMAVQCPTGEHYHVQSEHVIIEVIDKNGLPCKPGESGRVVVTSLNNFAKPLIRYVIGDLAEVGPACVCGRGLPVINKISGRIRNMFVRPNGETFWPVMPNPGKEASAKMPAVRRYQYVQKSPEWIEIRIAVEDGPYPADVEAAIIKAMQKEYGYPFHITFAYMKEIPSRGREKYEEFMNELTLEAEG